MPSQLEEEADVVIGQLSQEAASLEIATKVCGKGFCVVAPGFEDSVLRQALEEITTFAKTNRWQQANTVIQDGLLGTEGSAFIAELESPEKDHISREDGEVLMELDTAMTHLGFHIQPYLGSFGVEVTHRGRALIHQAGEPGEERVPLNDKEVVRWLSQFLRHKVMIIIFLGPSSGTLEMKPYNTDDAETYEIQTYPGTLVVLRPDILSHKHFSNGRSLAMSSFFLQGDRKPKRTKRSDKMVPAAKELDDWTVNRLRELKEKNLNSQFWDPDIPREWQSAMNHMFHKGQMIAVKGEACKVPATESPDAFCMATAFAPDYPQDVPRIRWDHEEVYDPDPESWRHFKSYCKHGSFMDGIELFDCKMFSMSPNEAKSMDPHQRLILEVGYEALFNMGMRKNTLVNTTCGVYVGCGNVEWSMMPRELDQGAFAATGGALSISSGRFSFTLGLKGPSMTIDTDASSGATSIYLGAEAVQRKGRATPNEFSVAIAAHLLLAAVWWPTHCASGWLCATGRCLTFDSSASGYVRGDGVAAVTLKASSQLVDGKYVTSEEEPLGSIAGAMMNNNGKGASLSAPHGPAEQEVVAEALQNASIVPADVDAVEAYGAGAFLPDAIEVGSMVRAHRSEDAKDPPLLMTSVKSSVGNQIETSGIISFMRVISAIRFGYATPNLHLRQANPHCDLENQPVNIATELMEYQKQSAFVGVMARGFGGSNIYTIAWGAMRDKNAQQVVISARDSIMYWPGGGGALATEQMPNHAYMIVGSWSQWQEAEAMEPEGDSTYTYIVVLGESRFEQFQIWLDGDPARVLHPGHAKGFKDTTVFGPGAMGHGCNWVIDGRQELPAIKVPKELGDESLLPKMATAIKMTEEKPGEAKPKCPAADYGMPGDSYRVTLRVTGRWRNVTWEKLPAGHPQARLSDQLTRERVSQFYIAGSWNDWNLSEMVPGEPGIYAATAVLWRDGGEFQILCNRDWSQVIHPKTPKAAMTQPLAGPDDQGHGMNWFLNGQAGDVFRIELTRRGESGMFEYDLKWERLVDEKQSQAATHQKYSIVGSWDNWETAKEMEFDGTYYKYIITLGLRNEESFQILLDGLRERTLHPDRANATPYTIHVLQGPSISAHGLNWTVGRDGGSTGSKYEVRLHLTKRGHPKNVDWVKLPN